MVETNLIKTDIINYFNFFSYYNDFLFVGFTKFNTNGACTLKSIKLIFRNASREVSSNFTIHEFKILVI